MSLFLGNPWVSDYNYEPTPDFDIPTVIPATSPDGYSAFANQTALGISIDTNKDFYPESSSPNYSGPNVVTINGQKFEVTPQNYSKLARQYIDYRRSLGDKSYDDPTPALTGNNTETTAGNNRTIALVDAYRQLANLKPVFYSVDPLTGVAIADDQAYTTVLNNPVYRTADAVSNAGTKLFNAGGSVIQGGSQAVSDLASVLGGVGEFLKKPGTILVIGGGILAFILWKKKVIS